MENRAKAAAEKKRGAGGGPGQQQPQAQKVAQRPVSAAPVAVKQARPKIEFEKVKNRVKTMTAEWKELQDEKEVLLR